MGHAGAIVSGSQGTAAAKAEALEAKRRARRPHADRGRRDRRRDPAGLGGPAGDGAARPARYARASMAAAPDDDARRTLAELEAKLRELERELLRGYEPEAVEADPFAGLGASRTPRRSSRREPSRARRAARRVPGDEAETASCPRRQAARRRRVDRVRAAERAPRRSRPTSARRAGLDAAPRVGVRAGAGARARAGAGVCSRAGAELRRRRTRRSRSLSEAPEPADEADPAFEAGPRARAGVRVHARAGVGAGHEPEPATPERSRARAGARARRALDQDALDVAHGLLATLRATIEDMGLTAERVTAEAHAVADDHGRTLRPPGARRAGRRARGGGGPGGRPPGGDRRRRGRARSPTPARSPPCATPWPRSPARATPTCAASRTGGRSSRSTSPHRPRERRRPSPRVPRRTPVRRPARPRARSGRSTTSSRPRPRPPPASSRSRRATTTSASPSLTRPSTSARWRRTSATGASSWRSHRATELEAIVGAAPKPAAERRPPGRRPAPVEAPASRRSRSRPRSQPPCGAGHRGRAARRRAASRAAEPVTEEDRPPPPSRSTPRSRWAAPPTRKSRPRGAARRREPVAEQSRSPKRSRRARGAGRRAPLAEPRRAAAAELLAAVDARSQPTSPRQPARRSRPRARARAAARRAGAAEVAAVAAQPEAEAPPVERYEAHPEPADPGEDPSWLAPPSRSSGALRVLLVDHAADRDRRRRAARVPAHALTDRRGRGRLPLRAWPPTRSRSPAARPRSTSSTSTGSRRRPPRAFAQRPRRRDGVRHGDRLRAAARVDRRAARRRARRRCSSPTARCRPTPSCSTTLVEPGDAVVVERPTYDRTLLTLRKRLARHARRSSSSPTASTSTRSRRCSTAASRRSSRTSSRTSRTRPASRCAARSASALLELAARARLHDLRGRPVRRRSASPASRCRRCSSLDDATAASSTPRSFSKTVCPGIRVGYLVGPAELIADIASARRTPTSRPNMVAQAIVHEFCRSGAIAALDRDGQHGAARARATRSRHALERELPDARFTAPEGGYFMWVELPEGTDVDALFAGRGRARRRVRQGHGLPARGRRATPCAWPTRASRPTRSTRASAAWPRPTTA